MRTIDEVQAGLISYLKDYTNLTALLANNGQIKETQWQGSDFVYPAVRVENDIMPEKDGCSPDAVEIFVYVMDEAKSSKRCSQVAAQVCHAMHNKNFTSETVKFIGVKVTKASYPRQQEGQSIWQSVIEIAAKVN